MESIIINKSRVCKGFQRPFFRHPPLDLACRPSSLRNFFSIQLWWKKIIIFLHTYYNFAKIKLMCKCTNDKYTLNQIARVLAQSNFRRPAPTSYFHTLFLIFQIPPSRQRGPNYEFPLCLQYSSPVICTFTLGYNSNAWLYFKEHH